MATWLDSIYSDGTGQFVSSPQPNAGETVTIRLRMICDAPPCRVLLRTEPNGEERCTEMQRCGEKSGLRYYEAPLKITEKRMRYRFYILAEETLYTYNQLGVTDATADGIYDFTLLTDYRQPSWVKNAVFYQIFPERFCCGDPALSVKDGELSLDGHPSIHMKWTDRPLPYHEGFCMDFFGGDLDGIREKIPYLKNLGVTALYLNPVFHSPSTHKYDCIDYLHVDPHFGGDEALARLSEALHENDMKLILDISINHTGTDHRWFNRDGRFFPEGEGAYHDPSSPERSYYFFEGDTDRYKGWHDVSTMPVLNYTSPALRDAVYRAQDSVVRKWLKPPYLIDGWRFDVADVFARNDLIQPADEVWPELCAAIREENPEAYILAEDWGDCSFRMQGRDYDATMNYYGCCRIIREFYGGKDMYLSHDPVIRNYPYRVSAAMVKSRIRGFLAKLPYVIAQNQFNLLDSHDVPRIAQMPHMTPEKLRGAVMLMFMLPGTPNVYYGDEAEIDGWTESMEGCRFPMPWDKDIESTDAYRFYRTLTELRGKHNALRDGGYHFLYAEGSVLALARFDEQEAFICVCSSSEREENAVLPLHHLGLSLPHDNTDLFGRTLRLTDTPDGELSITLAPEEAVLFPACYR